MISVTLLTAAAMTAISCPPSHPEIACGRCWENFKQAESSSDCRVCDSRVDCGPFESCQLDTNGDECGTLRVCKPAATFGEACNRNNFQCAQRGCGINLFCTNPDFSQQEGTCTYVNNQPQPCVTERCGRLIEHQSSGPSDDGCNTCFCDNGVLSCTEKACIGVEPPACGPLKEGDVCFATPLSFVPSVNRLDEPCPELTACRDSGLRSTLSKCLPVECTKDSDCPAGKFCSPFITRGGCRSYGTCRDVSTVGGSCFGQGTRCPSSKCASGLQCVDNVCAQ